MNGNLLDGNIKHLFSKFLLATLGSSMVTCIYAIVDCVCIGQYQGPDGTAALAIVMPLWTILYSIGLLTGIGGATLFGNAIGKGQIEEAKKSFTVSFFITLLIAFISWLLIVLFEDPLLRLFGADEQILPLAKRYLLPIKFVVPFYPFTQFLGAYLRTDNDPVLTSAAVLAGGVFNIFGDIFFTFTLDLGIFGAGLATALGIVITMLVLLIHFFKKNNQLKLVKPTALWHHTKQIIYIGFGAFVLDISIGIITILFNNQLKLYLAPEYLAIFGVIIQISTVVQSNAYAIGQSGQAIISVNYGAKNEKRVRQTLKYAVVTSLILGLFWCLLTLAIPNVFIRLFMKPNDFILNAAPKVMRIYAISYLFLPFNIFTAYYLQSVMKANQAIVLSLLRGIVFSSLFICLLPFLDSFLLWSAMIFVEGLVFILSALCIWKKKPFHRDRSEVGKTGV